MKLSRRNFQLTSLPRSESANSTLANSLHGAKWPGNWLLIKYIGPSYVYAPRKFQGTKWPGSERTRERIGPGAKRLGTLINCLTPACAGRDNETVVINRMLRGSSQRAMD